MNTLEINKRNVTEFFTKAFNEKDFVMASRYLGAKYIQHAPYVADGIEALENYIYTLRKDFPYSHCEIKKIFAEGDYVMLFVHLVKEPGTRGFALMELFRLESEKIVEHWNVVQEIPEKSANTNDIF